MNEKEIRNDSEIHCYIIDLAVWVSEDFGSTDSDCFVEFEDRISSHSSPFH